MTDRPLPQRPGARRGATVPTQIPSTIQWKKYIPYAVIAIAIAVLLILFRTPRYTTTAAVGLGLLLMTALSYFAIGLRSSLKPDDGLRALIIPPVVLCLIFTAVPYVSMVLPSKPVQEISLSHPDEVKTVQLSSFAPNVRLSVTSAIDPTAVGYAEYSLQVSHHTNEQISGRLRTRKDGPAWDAQTLSQSGQGEYRFQLRFVTESVIPPLKIGIITRPFSTLILAIAYGLLGIVVLAVDLAIAKRNVETYYAAAMFIPLISVGYLSSRLLAIDLQSDLLASLAAGVVAGGIGGLILSYIGQQVFQR